MLRWLPENVSSFGADVDGLMALIFWIVGVWLVIVEAVLIYFVVAYRRKPGRRAAYVPARGLKTLSWVLVPCAVILVFDLAIDAAGAPVWHTIKEQLPPPDLQVRVVGKQFGWDFVHPGADGTLDTGDDIATEFELNVPVDSVVHFELRSLDVVHSFWLPHLRLKQDVVPGRRIRGWFKATRTGEFPIACAELCGLGHDKMKGMLNVRSAADHEAWIAEQAEFAADEFWD